MKSSLWRRCALLAVGIVSGFSLIVGASTVAGAATGAHVGGNITEGNWSYSGLDQGQSGYAGGANPATMLIFGSLFLPPVPHSTKILPNLALSYTYNASDTKLTIHLRHGVKFQDGTAFNAAAVVWNLQRYANPITSVAQDFTTVSSMQASGQYTVIIRFTTPNAVMIQDLDDTAASNMGSPAAFNKLGALSYNYQPIGAGPYTVSSDTPGQSLTLARWPGYWDAKNVYLSTVTFNNSGSDPTAVYQDLESGSLSIASFYGATGPASILYQADSNPNLKRAQGLNTLTFIADMNINTLPFSNILAREAVDYCTDRQTLAKYTTQGFATPAYVVAGPGADFVSGTVKGKTVTGWQYGESLQPYLYNPAKGKQIVSQLGGLSFSFTNSSGGLTGTAGSPLAVALYQEWESCGMNVSNVTVSAAQANPTITSGDFQITLASDAVAQYPGLNIAFQTYGGALDSDAGGWNIPSIYALIAKANSVSNPVADAKIWHQIWAAENKNVVDMPVVSSSAFSYYNKCLTGLDFLGSAAQQVLHAYETC